MKLSCERFVKETNRSDDISESQQSEGQGFFGQRKDLSGKENFSGIICHGVARQIASCHFFPECCLGLLSFVVSDYPERLMNERFMKRAIELSRTHMLTGAGGPFGAVIVKDGKVIGEGWNQVTSTNDPTAHAEVVAIRNATQNMKAFDLQGAELYTSCEPCPMCLAAAYWARITKIYFGNTRSDAAKIQFDDDFIYQEIPKALEDRQIPMIQALPKEAHQVFEEWDQKTDKVRY